jgi:hypothetical protein
MIIMINTATPVDHGVVHHHGVHSGLKTGKGRYFYVFYLVVNNTSDHREPGTGTTPRRYIWVARLPRRRRSRRPRAIKGLSPYPPARLVSIAAAHGTGTDRNGYPSAMQISNDVTMATKSSIDTLNVKLANGVITTAQYKEMLAYLESDSTSLGYIQTDAGADQAQPGNRTRRFGIARFLARKG